MRLRELKSLRWVPILLKIIPIASAGAALLSKPYVASFQVPAVQLNKAVSIAYQINLTVAEPTLTGLNIVLCQSKDKLINETNSWQILDILRDFCLTKAPAPDGTCKNDPYKGRGSLQLNFTKDSAFNTNGDDTLNNFFFCFSSTEITTFTVCDYSSSLFDIFPAVSGSKPVDLDTLTTIPTIFPTPTSPAITITSTRSTVLQIQTPTATSLVVTPPPKSFSKPKSLTTPTKIGLAFGAISLLLVFGLIALLFFRRSSARKRVESNRSLNIHSSPQSNFHAEKDDPPISDKWDTLQKNSPLPKELPTINSSDGNIQGMTGLLSGSKMPQETPNSKSGPPDNVANYRQLNLRESGTNRSSGGSISISPIPSPRSQSLYEPFRDVDEEHVNKTIGMSSAAPFLREEGMSAEDMARLEDEERRIDAAIAAAEADKVQGWR